MCAYLDIPSAETTSANWPFRKHIRIGDGSSTTYLRMRQWKATAKWAVVLYFLATGINATCMWVIVHRHDAHRFVGIILPLTEFWQAAD